MDRLTGRSSGSGGNEQVQTGDDAGSDAPDTWRDFPQLVSDDPPDTLPTGQDPQDYATDVVVTADCEMNPMEMAVAKQHQTDTPCEHIVMTAAGGGGGDFYEIGLPFSWSVVDPTVVELFFPFGPDGNYATPIGKLDTFDLDGAVEPRTAVWACAMNGCPDPRPADCNDLVCATVNVLSVVNVEGSWILAGATFDDGAAADLTQDGRTFKDTWTGVKKGSVIGAFVSFEIDDYLYQGIIAPDRNHLKGQVWDSIGSNLLGDWRAERSSP